MGAGLNDLFGDAASIAPATPHSYGVPPTGFRLPGATHVSGVVLQVSNLQRSRDFYERLLGFHTLGTASTGVTLGAAGGSAPLIELVERVPDAATRPPGKRLGLFHVAILLPTRADLGRFVAHLQSLGVRAGAGDHLVSEAFYLQDPDDLGIEVYADRPQSTWQRRRRELVMATDPVDVRAVLAAGGTKVWRGMPSGTTIGHVHLHVGAIEPAARFYGDALGFDRMVWSYPGALFLAAGGYHHHLGTNTWAGPAATAPAADEPQLLEWALELPLASDVQAAAESLWSAGHHSVEHADGITARDPWGTMLRLRHRR